MPHTASIDGCVASAGVQFEPLAANQTEPNRTEPT
jgi:hypothetical protein